VRADQVVRFGTRGSALARAQTDLVIRRLNELHPEIQSEVVIIQTEGDRDKETPLTVIGGRGVFTNALQEALRRGEIDAAVHSAKDLPTEEAPGLTIAAFLERADPRDAFVSRHGKPLAELGPNPVIGTSSRRRQVQVLKLRPDAQLVDLRGNIDTRLQKAFVTELDGIVLAAAGIERMGWTEQITEYLEPNIAVPSPGQGALAVEVRAHEDGPASLLSELGDPSVSLEVETERAFLRAIGGGCTSPVGANAMNVLGRIWLRAMIGNVDGSRVLWLEELMPLSQSVSRAESRARELFARLENPSSLENVRFLVTRERAYNQLDADLRARGATTLIVPATKIETVAPSIIESSVRNLGDQRFDWIVFTSASAVEAFLDCEVGASLAKNTPVAVVGPSTGRALRDREIDATLQSDFHSAKALVEEMSTQDLAEKRVLFPHGNLARETLPDGLRALGAIVEEVLVYHTVETEVFDPHQIEIIDRVPVDAAIFCSPSSVHALAKGLGDRFRLLKKMVIACIGPTTAEAAQSAGLSVDVMPTMSTFGELINELERYFTQLKSRDSEHVGAVRSGIGELLA
jgi:hydroxymethylbilane synthase